MTRRVALVTGGARGIGRAICEGLAADERAVVVTDLLGDDAEATAAAIRDAGGEAMALPLDITDSAAVTAAVEAVTEAWGAPEVLVNCAGWDDFKLFVDTDEAFWDRIIDINYKGMLRTTHACLPAMQAAGWGRIVNIASDAGRVGSSMESVYSGAKGGVIAFTKTIAREAARAGVTANTVCPGPTDTPLLAELAGDGPQGEKMVTALERAVPMKRLAQPADIASAVVYFASEGAGYVTGQTLSVSGGLTMS